MENNRYVYDKDNVKEIFLKIKYIFSKDTAATIVISDFVKACEYGLAENVECGSELGNLVYEFNCEDFYVKIVVDVDLVDKFFIKDFYYKSENEIIDIFNLKFNRSRHCFI